MAFDRKDYGMNSGIPFIRIADRVEVTVDLKVKRVSGPPVAGSNSQSARRLPAARRGKRSTCPTYGSGRTAHRAGRAGYRTCSADAQCCQRARTA